MFAESIELNIWDVSKVMNKILSNNIEIEGIEQV